MNKLMLLLLSLFVAFQVNAATGIANVSGNWSSNATWGGSNPPTSSDAVTINAGIIVTVDITTAVCGTLNVSPGINGTGELDFNNGSILTVSGNVILAATGSRLGVIKMTNGGTLKLTGNFTTSGTSGTLTPGTGTIEFNGAGQSALPQNFTYNTLTLSNSGAKTFAGNLTCTGDLNLSGSATTSGITNLSVGGNVNLSGTSAGSFGQTLSITGNLNVGAGTTFSNTAGSYVLGVTGTTTVAGTLTLGSNSTMTYTGDVTINSSGTFNQSGTGAINYAGNLQNDGVYNNANTGTNTFTGSGKTISGANPIAIAKLTTSGTTTNNSNLTVSTTLTISAATLNNGTLTVSGAFSGASTLTNTATGTLNYSGASAIAPTLDATAVGNNVNYTGAGAQLVKITTYDVLSFSGAGTKTPPAGTITVQGNLTISAGTLALNTNNTLANISGNIIISGGTFAAGTGAITCAGITITGTLSMVNSSALTVNGDVSGAGTWTTGTTANTISLTGNWSFNGTSTGNGASVVFSGTTAQTLSGKISTGNGSLRINNANGLTLNSAITVGGTLTFTSGIIATTSANLLTLGNTATISGGSSTSYVDGPLAHNYTTTGAKTITCPIGKGGIYRPLTLSLTESAVTSTTYTTEMFNSSPVVNTIPGTLDAVSSIRYYSISESGGGSAFTAGSVLLNYGTDDGVSTAADVRIAQGPAAGGGNWTYLGGTGTAAPIGTITSTTVFTSLTNTIFTLADRFGGSNPLPIELSSFTSIVNGRDVNLKWETKTEQNSNNFIIERTSADGSATNLNWILVQSVKANFPSNAPKHYSFTDKNVQTGKYQYRLKMVENNGSFAYSKITEASITLPAYFELSQNYPNPFNPTTKISYIIPHDSKVTLEIFNLVGKRVAQVVNEQQAAGYYTVNFGSSSVNNIASGIYIYKLIAVDNNGKNFSSVKKMMLLK